ncbi:hypothetical protein O1B22_003582 [Vibrio cholerae]|nr:hypothetical protein [Vibrio cholerae]
MDGVIPAKIVQSCMTGMPIFISSFYDSNLLSDYLYVYDNNEDLRGLLEGFSFFEHSSKEAKIRDFALDNSSLKFEEKIIHSLIF